MYLAFSRPLQNKISSFLFLICIFSHLQIRAQEPVSFARAIGNLVLVMSIISIPIVGLIYGIRKILERGREPIIKKDAAYDLTLSGDENFIGSLHEGFQVIFNILKRCNRISDVQDKRAFLKECHSNFLFYGPPGAGKNHAVTWLKHLLDEEKIDVPFVVVKEVETSFVGGGANTLASVFTRLADQAAKSTTRCAICVFDELSSVIPDRDIEWGSNKTSDQLLKLTDGFEKKNNVTIFMIGLTNNLKKIDSAFRSRSCCYIFDYDAKILNAILKKNFDDTFLNECKTLRACLENNYRFFITDKPLSPRDVGAIRKTMFGHTLNDTNHEYKNFDEIQDKVALFNDCFELRPSEGNSMILYQKF